MDANAPISDAEVLSVETVGSGADQRMMVHVAHRQTGTTWDLARLVGTGDEEERIDHRTVMKALGYNRPRKFTDLIATHKAAGNISPFEVCPSGGQTQGGRPGRVFMLSAWELAFIIGKVETPEGNRMAVVIAKVFAAVMKYRMACPPAAPSESALSAAVAQALGAVPGLLADMNTMRVEMAAMRAELASGVVGEDAAERKIKDPLRRIAQLYAQSLKKYRGPLRTWDNKLRGVVKHLGKGSSWAMLPRRLLEVAEALLGTWLDDAIAANCPVAPSGPTFEQTNLPGV